jgi:N-glycosylase/DNA lyase
MSMGHLQAVPVDTHVFQIATNWYLPHLKKNKTVTTRVYDEISGHFQGLYGPLAGWAHTVKKLLLPMGKMFKKLF